jgi:integrase
MSSAALEFRLTARELAPMIRQSLKDKRYRATALGALVGRYIRWFRNEAGATPSSVRDYEGALARMALTLADKDPIEITLDDLREVIDLWADNEPATRAKVTSILRSFWEWAEEEGQVPFNPATRLRRPKKPKKTPRLLQVGTDARILTAAGSARDRLAALLLLDCGIRRGELAGIQARDLDLARRQVTVTGKGRKQRVIPLRGRIVLAAEEYLLDELPLIGRQPEPDDFLLYPEWRTPDGRVYKAEPKQPKKGNGIHRWWYRQLEDAGLVGKNVRSGLNMHRARHTFAQDVRRAHRDIGAVQHILGHSDPTTTISLYGGYAQEDLEAAMDDFARDKREAAE